MIKNYYTSDYVSEDVEKYGWWAVCDKDRKNVSTGVQCKDMLLAIFASEKLNESFTLFDYSYKAGERDDLHIIYRINPENTSLVGKTKLITDFVKNFIPDIEIEIDEENGYIIYKSKVNFKKIYLVSFTTLIIRLSAYIDVDKEEFIKILSEKMAYKNTKREDMLHFKKLQKIPSLNKLTEYIPDPEDNFFRCTLYFGGISSAISRYFDTF